GEDARAARAGGLLARARRPARRRRRLLDRDRVLALHVHGAGLEGDDGHDSVRPLRRLPVPAADLPGRPRRGALAGAADRPADPRHGRAVGAVGRTDSPVLLRPRLLGGALIVAGLAAAVVVGLGVYANFDDLRAALASFRWELFPLALALTFLNYLVRF